jgi:5-formyltetrahydrofolate cyclo-ligase
MREFADEWLSQPRDWQAVKAFRSERRSQLLAHRAAVPLRERQRRGERIRAQLNEALTMPSAAVLGIYWPIRGEPDLREIARVHVEGGGTAALPVVTVKSAPVEFWRWAPDSPMRIGFWNIPVPADEHVVAPDILLIPLVGFDRAGYRLGYGGGYYDRTLAATVPRPLCVGIGYATAELATIHPQPHDIPMDMIVTDEGVRRR